MVMMIIVMLSVLPLHLLSLSLHLLSLSQLQQIRLKLPALDHRAMGSNAATARGAVREVSCPLGRLRRTCT